MSKLTPPYVKRLQQHRATVWAVSGEEIEAWWRTRERVTHDAFKGSGTHLSFDVRSPGNVKGIKFMVTHPAADVAPKSVKAANPDVPLPELKRIDAFRSALIFQQSLKVGHYDYSLEF